ncbi:thioredoxin-dependent thiol peroxidase [Flectobacillus sp. BAB-3569]|uniref:thioredoxin-dependent thiol peroxidase n=1 Tax=Flectobacillus sp. BAB-3569 TaxID=1509483 RepID=UPI000BA2BF97|nr:thioredoxin-dependent thiol peroxidase [Flectobacillus sp. BAB-3569]PAC30692.1 thioredoxin-dependent thiol peroxidase [Flectobacillus sp. BAB-3569]
MSLTVGSVAPDFEQKNQDGELVKLSDFRGQKVVLYFYPKDSTPGCTAQACNLNDNLDGLKAKGYVVLGVSVDSPKSHKKFIEKYGLGFTLISDEDHSVVEAYGVWVEKSMYGRSYMGTARTTFIIDENGVIQDIISKVDTKNHTSQVITE